MTLTDSPQHGSPDPDAPTTVTAERRRRRPGRRTIVIASVVAGLVLVGLVAALLVATLRGGDGPDDAGIARAFERPAAAGAPAAGAPAAGAVPGGATGPAGGPAGGPGGGPAGGPGGPGAAAPLLGAVSHGEFVLDSSANGRVIDVQRGEVVAVTPTSLTVRSTDGFTATYRLEAGVRIDKDGGQTTVSSLAAGDDGMVVADRDAGGLVATTVTIG